MFIDAIYISIGPLKRVKLLNPETTSLFIMLNDSTVLTRH